MNQDQPASQATGLPSLNEPPEAVPDDLMYLPQACRLIGVSMHTMRRWVLNGRIRAWRIERRYRVSRADVLAKIERVRVTNQGKPVQPTQQDLDAKQEYMRQMASQMGIL